MKKLITLTLLLIGFSQIETLFCGKELACIFGLSSAKATIPLGILVSGKESGTVVCKTATECYEAALQISLENTSADDYPMKWRKKFDLLKRAIDLDPKFTDAHVPYVKTYFLAPLRHEIHREDELDELIALLKKGLEYNPKNGDEFYLQLVKLEADRWGYTQDSLRRSIIYLNEALNKHPNTSLKKDILSLIYLNHSYLGEYSEGVKYLWQIVNLNEREPADESAFESLMLYYDSIDNYPNLIKTSEMFLARFGHSANFSCYAMYCGALSSNKLGLHDKMIEIGQKYIEKCSKGRKGDITTNKRIYYFLSEAYVNKGNSELANRFKKMSE